MAGRLLVAAGLIIFRRINQNIDYLLLQTSYGDHHWTPPKGHVDPGESELETAYRETREEAGLAECHLDIVSGFEKILHYDVRGVPKKVVYWLAQLRDPNTPIVLSHEHQHYEWLTLDAAVQRAGFLDMQETLRQADSFIRSTCTNLR
jgi:bis(5'-nucleosidyl)-tetraphosphatase